MEHPTCRNKLINHTDQKTHDALLKECQWMFLSTTSDLASHDLSDDYAYFPSGAIIMLLMHQPTTKSLAIGLVGEEGLFGAASILGVERLAYNAIVQSEGWVLKISNIALHNLMLSYPNLNQLLLAYMAVLHAQLAQSVVCHHFHLLPQRLACLLVSLQEKLHTSTFFITQDFLSSLLGVRRVGVTKAAGFLQQKEIVSYSRGHMRIINTPALEHIACQCYAIDKLTYQTMMHFEQKPLPSTPKKRGVLF